MDSLHHNVVVDTVYGPLLVNRHAGEYDSLAKIGKSAGSHAAIETVCALAFCCGPSALVIDVGACFGTFAIPLARTLRDRGGYLIAFEPQQWLFHCLCGSVALNDLDNAMCYLAAAGHENGVCTMPGLDYRVSAHFGSVPVIEWATLNAYDDIGQDTGNGTPQMVRMMTIDSLGVSPSLMKIDTEGMEIRVLMGAEQTIARCRPVLYVEHIKCGEPELLRWFHGKNYDLHVNGCDYICIPDEKRDNFPKIEY